MSAVKMVGLPGFGSLAPAESEAIDAAEKELGLAFAKEYRDVLGLYGSICTDDHEMIGLGPSKRLNVVAVTEELRALYAALGDDLYVIEDLGIDGLLICQDSAGVIYELAPNGKPRKIAATLLEYLSE